MTVAGESQLLLFSGPQHHQTLRLAICRNTLQKQCEKDMNYISMWVLMIAVMVISFIIQRVLQSKMDKYSNVLNHSGRTGAEIAAKMLADNGIYDVEIGCVEGSLTDHYDPRTKVVNLSRDVYYGNSVAAAAIAAHECGHAVQHQHGYAPLKLRSALVPVVSFANMAVQWVLLAGVLLINVFPSLLWAGIILFAMTTLFSLITLPVEINASSRAVAWLETQGITGSQAAMSKDALKWAAYTYVIAAIGSIATLIYYISLGSRR